MTNTKIQKRMKRSTGRLIIVVSILAILIALYCLACFELDNNKIWKNVSINGVSMQGLTKKEAQNALTKDFEERYKDASLTVNLHEKKYSVNISSVLGFDSSKELTEAYRLGHRGFLLRGIDWVLSKTLYGKTEKVDTYPHAQEEDKILEAIKASGLPERDPASETTWEVKDNTLVIHKGAEKDGADLDKLQTLITEAIKNHDYSSTIACPLIKKGPGKVDFQKIYDKVYQKKKNATLDKKNNYSIIESKNEISFDVKKAEQQYEAAGFGEQVNIALKITEPTVTTQKLKNNLFTKELGSYKTNGGGSEGRKTNISLAAKACNGVILLPGETFSYNDVLGERTAARGYKAAGAYADGEVVEQLGGGICQVSSTLFAAVLHTNLEITTRFNHSMPVSYLPMGMDATVSWGGPEFKFKNNLTYPIKIVASYSGGVVSFKILGAVSDYQKIDVEVKKNGELSCETYRKYHDKNGNVSKSVRICRSNYKPHT